MNDEFYCVHSKFVRGCPSCAVRVLKYWGVLSEQPTTGNIVGINCWREDAWRRTPEGQRAPLAG